MIPEPMSEAVGRAHIEPADAVAPETEARWTVTYQVGEAALGPGSLIRFTIPYGFTTPNFLWVSRPGYCHLTCSREGVVLRFVLPEPVQGPFHNFYMYRWGAHVFVEVSGGSLTEGDTVSLIYGHNPFYPQKWARSSYFTQEFTWWVAVRPASAEGEEFILVADPPTLWVEPGPLKRVGAVAPSLAARGETLRLRTYGEDVHRNRIVPLTGSGNLRLAPLSAEEGADASSEALTPTVEVRVEEAGTLQAVVQVEDVAEAGLSNPILVREEPLEYRLYWGDIHGHSIQSDGLGTVEEYYAYGRDVALLDFCSVADHAGQMGPGEWERSRAAADGANDPGRYVTFSGYELNDQAGEKCIYFRHGSTGSPCPEPVEGHDSHPMYRYPDDEETLFRLARAGEALIVPHQHGRGPWPYPKDVIRVTEVYSIWGAFEYPTNPRPCISGGDYTGRTVLDMLLAGYRPGVIGGSDCHAGHPGHTDWLRACRAYWCGLAAVYAQELTQEALWEALLARRCYATTGPRIIVDLRSEGAWMGSEVAMETTRRGEPVAPRTFDIQVVGTEALKRVTLVKNGQPRFMLPGDGQVLSTTLTDHEGPGEPAFYYLRVEQEDGEMAWSSPLWFVRSQQGRE